MRCHPEEAVGRRGRAEPHLGAHVVLAARAVAAPAARHSRLNGDLVPGVEVADATPAPVVGLLASNDYLVS